MTLVSVADVRCTRTANSRADEEWSDVPTLVVPRRGTFRFHGTRTSAIADANTVLLFHPDEPYCITHPNDDGDDCTALRFDREAASDALGHAGRSARAWLLPAAAQRTLHAAARRMLAGADVLEREERALAILGGLAGVPALAAAGPHAARLERVRERIASAPGENVTLSSYAQTEAMSPFHLMRRFRAHAGTSIHQYRLALRLNVARTMLLDGADDITRIAADLGFAHAAHFASAFRRAYGCRPTDVRRLRASPRSRPRTS
jgi:AraC-like DNA-binding protein